MLTKYFKLSVLHIISNSQAMWDVVKHMFTQSNFMLRRFFLLKVKPIFKNTWMYSFNLLLDIISV